MDGAFPSQRGQQFEGGDGYDRSPGGGAAGSAAGRRGFRGTAENAKTKLCNRWLQGDCRFGDRCNFAHGDEELRKGSGGREENGGGRFSAGRGGGRDGGFSGYGAAGGYGGRGGGRGEEFYYHQQQAAGGYNPAGYGGGYHHHPQEQQQHHHHHPSQQHPPGMMSGYGAGGPGAEYGAGPRGGAMGQPGMQDEAAWAAQGYPVTGPNGWIMYRTRDTGEHYYHNHKLNLTQWERPVEWP